MSGSRSLQMEARRTPDPGVDRKRHKETLRNAWLLSKREISLSVISYSITVFATLLLGLLVVGMEFFNLLYAWGENTTQASSLAPSNWVLDFFFLLFVSLLAINWFAEGWSFPWRNVFSKRYAFLRILPIDSRDLIAGRVLTMTLTLLSLSALFFLPGYLLANLLGTEQFLDAVRSQLNLLQYLWFVIIWIMFGLVAGGFHLYMESGVRGRSILIVQLAWYLPLLLLVFVVSPAIDGIVAGTLRLVQQYGPLPAVVAAIVGGPLFSLWVVAAKRRLERRDLVS